VPFSVESIDHVEVFVRDIDASVRWYARVLGLAEIGRWDPEPVMIGAGGTKLAFFAGGGDARGTDWGESATPLRWHRVAWKTDRDGFEEAQRHLSACGVVFRGPIDHGIARSIYFRDPDGHPLEITTYSE
jgi:catechol 2,3-dioxygenase-like lactoylglutathione lyase family enzyme